MDKVPTNGRILNALSRRGTGGEGEKGVLS